MRVLFLSPEAVPFAKTGGLADVAGALPGALRRLGVDVRILLPFYPSAERSGCVFRSIPCPVEIPLGPARLGYGILETRNPDGVPVYLIDRKDFFERPYLYGPPEGDYGDNLERFAFFSRAALETCRIVDFAPDILHCHDWQTGLLPALLKGPYGGDPFFKGTRSVFTLHNIGYQGIFSQGKLPLTGIPWEGFYHMDGLEYHGNICLLKAGIAFGDRLTTVSPRYALEIQGPEQGRGLEGILRKRGADLVGILNGVDYRTWDPATDDLLPATYRPGDLSGKTRCKKALIAACGLDPELEAKPVVGVVSRFETQKGMDLLMWGIDEILSLDMGLVVLGSGSPWIREGLRQAEGRHRGRMHLQVGFDDVLAHRIFAGADLFLIPSLYEPCGLTQMYALRYGTVPVVRATGGLDDTIQGFDPREGKGNGFKFRPYEVHAMIRTLREAVGVFRDRPLWGVLLQNAMAAAFTWERSAETYLHLFSSLRGRGML